MDVLDEEVVARALAAAWPRGLELAGKALEKGLEGGVNTIHRFED